MHGAYAVARSEDRYRRDEAEHRERCSAHSRNTTPRWRASHSCRPLRRKFYRSAALAFVFLTASLATQAHAQVAVDGGRDAMRVSVANDTVGHVLEALSEHGSLGYRSTTPLNKVVGGSFSGSLGQVLSRILVGFDFIAIYKPQGVELYVYGESGAKPVTFSRIDPPQSQKASTVAEKTAPDTPLTPRHLVPRTPNKYDMATSNLRR